MESFHLEGRIIGDYELVERIGSGGFGTVYRAQHTRHQKSFVIKVMKHLKDASSQEVQRFQREANSLALLDHPNIVQMIDFDWEPDLGFYLVLEWLKGISLKDHLHQHKRLPLEEAHALFKQLFAGLAEAHRQGIVHRDLKPSNLMLLPSGDSHILKILDFGVAFLLDSPRLTKPGVSIGSISYMSPEQALGKRDLIDQRSDLFSSGVLLTRCLTGQLPYQGNPMAIVLQHRQQTPPLRLRSLYPEGGFSQELEEIICTALQPIRSHRFKNIEDFSDALNTCIEGGQSTDAFDPLTTQPNLELGGPVPAMPFATTFSLSDMAEDAAQESDRHSMDALSIKAALPSASGPIPPEEYSIAPAETPGQFDKTLPNQFDAGRIEQAIAHRQQQQVTPATIEAWDPSNESQDAPDDEKPSPDKTLPSLDITDKDLDKKFAAIRDKKKQKEEIPSVSLVETPLESREETRTSDEFLVPAQEAEAPEAPQTSPHLDTDPVPQNIADVLSVVEKESPVPPPKRAQRTDNNDPPSESPQGAEKDDAPASSDKNKGMNTLLGELSSLDIEQELREDLMTPAEMTQPPSQNSADKKPSSPKKPSSHKQPSPRKQPSQSKSKRRPPISTNASPAASVTPKIWLWAMILLFLFVTGFWAYQFLTRSITPPKAPEDRSIEKYLTP